MLFIFNERIFDKTKIFPFYLICQQLNLLTEKPFSNSLLTFSNEF